MNRSGVVLIEVLLAVTILSMAGLSAVAFLSSAADAQRRLHQRELELAGAERVLTATALLTRTELQRRMGIRKAGAFVVWVDRPQPSLFRIGVAPAHQPEAELLATLVYRRPEEESDAE